MTSNLLMSALLAMAVCGAAFGAQPAPPRDRGAIDRDILLVTGTGESRGAPDVAYVTVGVVTQGRNAQEASQANAAQTQKVMAALRQQGIADKDLQTSNYSVQPRYENRPGRDPAIVGYDVSNQVRATVRKLGAVGEILDAALTAGANNVQGVYFGMEARSEHEDRALAAAVKAARRKADVLAAAAGVRITGVAQIHEGFAQRPVPLMAARGFAAAEAAPTPISPGELTVTANVTIAYTIAPRE